MDAETQKYQIVSKLSLGTDPKSIATEFDIPYTKVLRVKKQFETAKANNDFEGFIDMDEVMLKQLLEQAEANVPAELAEAASTAVSSITKAKTLLDALSEDMVITAKVITNHIKQHANNIDHVSELESLTSSLCALQNAFFNSNKTQVNVQNNYGDAGSPARSYGEFLSDKPSNN